MDLINNNQLHDLENEYCNILRTIKKHIVYVMDNRFLPYYSAWLEKLNGSTMDMHKRNQYLSELCRQIQAGVLEGSFTSAPPKGPLPRLQNGYETQAEQRNTARQYLTHELSVEEQNLLSPYFPSIEKLDNQQDNTEKSQHQENIAKPKTNFEQNRLRGKSAKTSRSNESTKFAKGLKERRFSSRSPNSKQECGKSSWNKQHYESPSKTDHDFFIEEPLDPHNSFVGDQQHPKLKQHHTIVIPQQYNHNTVDGADHQSIYIPNLVFPDDENPTSIFKTTRKSFKEPEVPQTEIKRLPKDFKQLRFEQYPLQYNYDYRPYVYTCAPRASPNLQHEMTINGGSNKTDEGSWYDVTDASATTINGLGSGDNEASINLQQCYENDEDDLDQDKINDYEAKITKMMTIIKELKLENLMLCHQVQECEKNLNLRNAKAETSIHNITGEVEGLKSRLQELTEIKCVLDNSQITVGSEWESTIDTLHKKLRVTHYNNNELKSSLSKLEQKLEEFEQEKRQEIAALKKKLVDLHAKEIAMLKQTQVKNLQELEAKFREKLYNQEDIFNHKIRELNEQHSNEMDELQTQYDTNLRSKNAEIERLENVVQDQYKKMQQEIDNIQKQVEENSATSRENNLTKIGVLQSYIVKMEKLFQKSERKNTKQINKLKHEIEMRDKMIQVQLMKQKAELITSSSCNNQADIDKIVSQLEERYKKLLEVQKTNALLVKHHDMQMIAELSTQLAKYDIHGS